jgi:hypothetical protein
VLIAHAAWHWLQERFDRLQQFPLPAFDAATGAAVMRGAMYVLMTCAALWFGRMWWRQRVAGGVMEKRNDV